MSNRYRPADTDFEVSAGGKVGLTVSDETHKPITLHPRYVPRDVVHISMHTNDDALRRKRQGRMRESLPSNFDTQVRMKMAGIYRKERA